MASLSSSAKKQLGVEFPMMPLGASSSAYDDSHNNGGGGLRFGNTVRLFATHENTFSYYLSRLGAALEVSAAGLHTLCDVQGAGVLTHIVGLSNVSSSSNDYNNNPTRIEVTIDGRKYVVDHADGFKERKIVGAVRYDGDLNYAPNIIAVPQKNRLKQRMLKNDRLNMADDVPFVRFERSLKIEVYRMDMPVSPTRNENWCGAAFKLDSDIEGVQAS